MHKITARLSQTSGLPPGTPVFVGTQKTEEVGITIIEYDGDHYARRSAQTLEECCSTLTEQPGVTWINVDGLHDTNLIEGIGRHFGLHPLVIEDILNTHQRLKIDVFEEYLFIVLKMYWFDEDSKDINIEQLSIVLGRDFVLTFQEQVGDAFAPLRERLEANKGRIRKAGADYLAHALMDAIFDEYFEILERIGEKIDNLEDEVLEKADNTILHEIHALKRHLIFFRKTVAPVRTMLAELQRQETPLIQQDTLIYYRDLMDHVIQIMDSIETFRDIMSGIHDIYLSSVSNKMNEVMQFLTIIGTIFIPLTFIAGIYGMNFQYMPELGWRWGYFGVLGLMLVLGGGLLLYFRRKGWF